MRVSYETRLNLAAYRLTRKSASDENEIPRLEPLSGTDRAAIDGALKFEDRRTEARVEPSAVVIIADSLPRYPRFECPSSVTRLNGSPARAYMVPLPLEGLLFRDRPGKLQPHMWNGEVVLPIPHYVLACGAEEYGLPVTSSLDDLATYVRRLFPYYSASSGKGTNGKAIQYVLFAERGIRIVNCDRVPELDTESLRAFGCTLQNDWAHGWSGSREFWAGYREGILIDGKRFEISAEDPADD